MLFSAADAETGAAFGVSGGAVIKEVTGDSFYKDNTAGYMNFPGAPLSIPLSQISWEKAGARAELPLKTTDASDYRAIVIELAQDSTSELNRNQNQSMTVILTDAAGKTSRIELPRGTPALEWRNGEIEDILGWEGELICTQYTGYTPLSCAVLPLKDFAGVDPAALKSVTLEFAGSDSGCIVVRSVSLVP